MILSRLTSVGTPRTRETFLTGLKEAETQLLSEQDPLQTILMVLLLVSSLSLGGVQIYIE